MIQSIEKLLIFEDLSVSILYETMLKMTKTLDNGEEATLRLEIQLNSGEG